MMSIHISRVQRPVRFRQARSDARLKVVQETIETKFGLPSGSIRIIHPNGRKMRSDATIKKLKAAWEN